MKNPEWEDIPAWYELSFRKKDCSILIRIHEKAFEELCKIDWTNAPIIKYWEGQFGQGSFVRPNKGDWGFGKVFRFLDLPSKPWSLWQFKLPNIKAREDDRGLIKLRVSIQVLFLVLSLFDGDTGYNQKQLMVMEGFHTEVGPHGGSLSVVLTPTMISWLSKFPEHSELTHVVDAMKETDLHMWPSKTSYREYSRFGALCRKPKWLNLTVPGDACGLDPDSYTGTNDGRGYSLCPHNVDSSLQQLTFLAGLAALHDIVR